MRVGKRSGGPRSGPAWVVAEAEDRRNSFDSVVAVPGSESIFKVGTDAACMSALTLIAWSGL